MVRKTTDAPSRIEITEKTDHQTESMGEKVEQLSAKWQAWAKRADVLPLGAWRGNFGKQKTN